ncbi:hypothetical protein [Halomontanus rarus]|uniref:hypothetical protein n=1 Tax=Halomontanus rarus TaxID=3034020 RepID=UPI0023E7B648|nr:hypothetical protein [Halovivax sp. TS33]
MSDHSNRSFSITPQSFQTTAFKPLLALLGFCGSFLAAGFVLQLLGFGLWAGLFGAIFVIFVLTVVLGAVLMWTLGRVGY